MIRCPQARTLMGPYLYGSLDPDDLQRLESHVAACSSCRQALRALRATVAQIPRELLRPDDGATYRVRNRVLRQVEQTQAQARYTKGFLRSGWAAAAALCFFLLGLPLGAALFPRVETVTVVREQIREVPVVSAPVSGDSLSTPLSGAKQVTANASPKPRGLKPSRAAVRRSGATSNRATPLIPPPSQLTPLVDDQSGELTVDLSAPSLAPSVEPAALTLASPPAATPTPPASPSAGDSPSPPCGEDKPSPDPTVPPSPAADCSASPLADPSLAPDKPAPRPAAEAHPSSPSS